ANSRQNHLEQMAQLGLFQTVGYLTPLQELSQFSRKFSTDEQGRRFSYAFALVRVSLDLRIRGFLIFHIIA
ncbi:hypothetical protein L9F63_018548, partial [Diploptera punctata]